MRGQTKVFIGETIQSPYLVGSTLPFDLDHLPAQGGVTPTSLQVLDISHRGHLLVKIGDKDRWLSPARVAKEG